MGTANSAGQLAEFARAICAARPDVGAEVVMAANPTHLTYPADVHVERRVLDDKGFQRWRLSRTAIHYTHVVSDGFRPVFGYLNGVSVDVDLPLLRAWRVPTALLGHGSELRDPAAHLDRHDCSAYRDAPADVVEKLHRTTARNRRTAAESGAPVFVTTPDLLDDAPNAVWTPLVIDVDAWDCDRTVMERPVPVVVHAPSRRWTKGSATILPVLQSLHDKGAIEFRLLEGVPHDRMHAFIQDADIVVDQLGIGSYGVLACEAMAAGKPVVAYIGESSAARYGPGLPVVNATPKNLEDVMESLLEDRDGTRRIAAASRRYVREIHDGSLTATRLAAFLDA
jgi:hypothetical protein